MTPKTKLLPAASALVALFLAGCIIQRDGSTDLGGDGPSGSDAVAAKRSEGCTTCHAGLAAPSMHKTVAIGCAECHGGNPEVRRPEGASDARPYGDAYLEARDRAHVLPAFPMDRAIPERSYALLNREKPSYVRFVNPGDLRVAKVTCGKCHPKETETVPTSIMAHSAMVPGSGLYNNGALAFKNYLVGEFYMPDGNAALARAGRPATPAEKGRGVLDILYPYPRWETAQPGNIFRVLERGNAANNRGLGTLGKIDAVFLTANKTRLNDPNLWLMGNNDYPGDYRSSGCTACHVPYANDEGAASGSLAKFGRNGCSSSKDPTSVNTEPGHPIEHAFTSRVPTSQCLTCHLHQGSGAIGNYVGIEWWDGESDGEQVYKADGSLKTGAELCEIDKLTNPKSKIVKFTGHHRSGWSFRKIFKRDVEGQLLDRDGKAVDPNDPDWDQKAVHMADAHFKAGMHCVDCHTHQDIHGDGKLYGAMVDAVEITCVDCHGTIARRASLVTSNPAGGTDLTKARTPAGKPWFERGEDGKSVLQRSRVDDNLSWQVPQLVDVVDPVSKSYNKKAAMAKTLLRDGKHFGDPDVDPAELAHSGEQIHCYACHSSWTVSCAGCHLAQRVNARTDVKHYMGEKTKNDVAYYSQGLRHDSFVLGVSGTVQKNKIGPVRSASAVAATTEDGNNGVVTHQQPTISGAGFSGTAYSPFIPHTVGNKDAKKCSSCHVSTDDDNNSQLATLFGLGAHATDFVGEYAYLALEEGGMTAVKVTEGWEPQPVIGSDFHKLVHPDSFARFQAGGRVLDEQYGHRSSSARSIQHRGEYVFLADGASGLRVYDVVNIANKNVAQRIVTAPFSPLGHDTHVATKNATAVLLPSSVPLDPLRSQDPASKERPVNRMFGYAFVTDSEEGLITVDVNTLIDGDPENNFLERAATFNPDGKLNGARGGAFVGRYLYVLTDRGITVVDVNDAAHPALVTEITEGLKKPRALDVEFRYAGVVDEEGFKVLDVTTPEAPVLVNGSLVPLADARGVRISRTYAYVAAGSEGLAVIDVKRFRQPRLVEKYTAEGAINDASAVTTGLTNASMFAYVADGRNGLRVVELVTPSRQPQADGYSPPPKPRLIATCPTSGRAIAISTGAQRDRAVDESGNQMSVFGRVGSRPLDLEERRRFLLRQGALFTVNDDGRGLEEQVLSTGRARREVAELEAEIAKLTKETNELPRTSPRRKELREKIAVLETQLAAARAKLAPTTAPPAPQPSAEITETEKELEKARAELEALPRMSPRRKDLKEKITGLEAKLVELKGSK